ncbi:MFS transporter [Brevibacillus sp. HB1.3]|uniref:MFS transporter n=1 Tax=Brevibacillus sp. HB1.3 TaxID=2738842 RepID=UPI0015582C1E|nr:MFS transporter [Brevibacillus sp. HB1.3]NQF14773.1 MFS transporter [Brevibacillus sp. HB1.3]
MKFHLFANPNFSLFLFRHSTSEFGTICLNVAFALYILALTGSAGKFASILALGVIPQILFGPFAGVWADRLDKRKLLCSIDLIYGIFLLSLFFFSLFQPIKETIIYVAVLFFSVCNLLAVPAYTTLLQHVVKKTELTDAIALDSTIVESVRVLAPLIGTLLYTMSGIGAVFLLNAVLSLSSAASTYFMRLPSIPRASSSSSIIKELQEGLQIFTTDLRISSLVLNGLFTHIFLFPFVMIGFPYMIKQVFGGSDIDFGLVESAQTMGSVSSIIGVILLKKRFSVSHSIGIGLIGIVAAVFPLLLLGSHSFLQHLQTSPFAVVLFYSLVSYFLFSMFNIYGVFFRTFYQQTIESHMLGRFISVMVMLFAVGRLIGFQLYGALFDSTELVYAVFVLGVGMLAKIFIHIPFMRIEKRRRASCPNSTQKMNDGL